MALDIAFFRRVMGQFATGVTIVTTRSPSGFVGLTANSFTSVSLDPMLVLVCIDLRSKTLPFFRAGGVFAVNILTREQEALSNHFASASEKRAEYFSNARHFIAATGAPILAGTMGFVDTRITAEYPGGDHAIFLGQVEAMGYEGHTFFVPGSSREHSTLPASVETIDAPNLHGHNGHNGQREPDQASASPLLYHRGKYHHLSSSYQYDHPDLSPVTTQHE